jgi:8-oxo-dGTP pyrophosphatase MutT (NUDIX family)
LTTSLEELRRSFAGHTPHLDPGEWKSLASVAMVVREEDSDLSLLFIERARSQGDRWSGHIAFPGGRVDEGDAGPREAAERETLEEVGLRLGEGDRIARLDDLVGQSDSILVSCFVYGIESDPPLSQNHEVEQAFWLKLSEIEDERRHVERSFPYLGQELFLPAIRVLDQEEPVLWGLSYRFIQHFMDRIGREIRPMVWHSNL